MSDRLRLGLIDNALDFLEQAAEDTAANDARRSKYAILHLSAGIELLLKARLIEEHWALVFADPRRARGTDFRRGSFRSVDFAGALARLRRIAGIEFSRPDVKALGALRILRNQMQHFAIDIEHDAAMARMATGYAFGVAFCEHHLARVLSPEQKASLAGIASKLRDFDEFVEARMEAIAPEVHGLSDVVECPRCGQETLGLGVDDGKCRFCTHAATPAELAREVYGDSDPEPCPHCGGPAVGASEGEWHCLECRESGWTRRCDHCNALVADPEAFICDECMDRAIERDD